MRYRGFSFSWSALSFCCGACTAVLLALGLRRLMLPRAPWSQQPRHRLDSSNGRCATTGLPNTSATNGCAPATASVSTAGNCAGYLGDRIATARLQYGSPSWHQFIGSIETYVNGSGDSWSG